ncbi:hypothetical protein Tco_0738499 [Tanacetum coccineum]
MVACLEKSEGNADFHEIMDFLTASSVHYALTVSPTIYASYIEWSDLHFNDEDGITCLTNDAIFENLALMGYESDSNKLTFQKSLFSPQWKYLKHTILHYLSSKSTSWNEFSTSIASVVICLANGQKFNFSKLIFDDYSCRTFNDVYQTPAHPKKVFTNMKRNGKDFLRRVTPLFASMLAPPVVEGEGSEDTQLPQTSVPIPNVADEAVFKEQDDRVVRATTTTASLDATQASGNISNTQSMAMSNDPLSQEIGSGGNTPGSDDERIKQDDLMDFVPPTPHDSPLSGGHMPRSDEVIRKLKKKVKRLEKKQRARTPGMKLFKICTSKRKSLDKEYVSKQGRKSDKTKPMFDDSDFAELDVDNAMENVGGDAETQGRNTAEQITTVGDTVNTASIDVSAAGPLNISTADPSTSTAMDIFEDEMMTIADTLVATRSTRTRTTSEIIHDVEEEPRRATSVPTVQSQDKGKGKMMEPEPTLKNPIKAQIQRDADIAQRLFE